MTPHHDHTAATHPLTAHAHDEQGAHGGHDPNTFRQRFWVAFALTVPVLYFSEEFQHWFGYRALEFPGSVWLSPLLATLLYVYGGWVFLAGARRELAARRPGMMTLVSLAITTAYVYSMAVAFGLPGMSFFWELATLITIMLLGHWLEMASVAGASKALEGLAALIPATARRLEGERTIEVPVSALRAGEPILVRPGEQFPADGRVLEGKSSVNEAFLSGESRPVPKAAGDEVMAGAINLEGALSVAVSRTGDQTTLSQIQRLVAEAQRARSRFQTLADRAAGWLFYIAVFVGLATFVAWLAATGDLQTAVTRLVTVLVIACPHALGLAVPLVVLNATALSARHGILVRNREAFERARDIRRVAFDKTGTLTEGRLSLRRVVADGTSEDEALALAAALERRSEHPLAAAIVQAADERGLNARAATDVEAVSGQGVRGRVAGARYGVGRPEWLAELKLSLSPALAAALADADARGESAVVLYSEARPLAVLALADRVRERAADAVRGLRARGVEVVMITGDAEAVARTVAADLGIGRYYARVLPEEKAARVRALKQEGPIAFVGDGINDAPALVEADLGIAIGAGTNVAIEAADVVLSENDPNDVLATLALAQASYRKMTQNLFWATGYNAVALPLAAGVLASAGILLSPAVGAVLMSASTIVVAINATLLRRMRFG